MENKKLTPIEYIMQYLGVQEGEEFNVLEINGSEWKRNCNPFVFDDGDLFDNYWDIRNDVLIELINGTLIVGKLPWKPKNKDTVWYIGEDGCVYDVTYTGIAADLAMLKNGWLFRTKEEAEANKGRIMKEYAEVISYD